MSDHGEARRLLTVLDPDPHATWIFAAVWPVPDDDIGTVVLRGLFEEHEAELERLNNLPKRSSATGFGIYFVPNECDHHATNKFGQPARSARDVIAVRSLFVDCDRDDPDQAIAKAFGPDAPARIAVETSPGKVQLYWPVEKGLIEPQDAKAWQQMMVRAFAQWADPACVDPSRLMRLPSFRNTKPRYATDGVLPTSRLVLHDLGS